MLFFRKHSYMLKSKQKPRGLLYQGSLYYHLFTEYVQNETWYRYFKITRCSATEFKVTFFVFVHDYGSFKIEELKQVLEVSYIYVNAKPRRQLDVQIKEVVEKVYKQFLRGIYESATID